MAKSSHTTWRFRDPSGVFELAAPDYCSTLYFPLVNERGLVSVVTPGLHGDIKTNQNTFLTAPLLLEDTLQFRGDPGVFFAGQLTGVEGYLESAATGLLAGLAIVLVVGVGCGFISAFIAAPIVTIVFGGVTASGTDLLVAAFQQVGSSLSDAVLQQALLSDTIDKTVEYLIVFTLLGAMSRRMTARFPQGERAVGTIEA